MNNYIINKIYLFSFILFFVSTLLPFKDKGISYMDPQYYSEDNTSIIKAKTIKPLKEIYKNDVKINFEDTNDKFQDAPNIQAKSAIVVDVNTNKILYKKNEEMLLPVASLAKIMTAIISTEYLNFEDLLTVSSNAANIGENSMGLKEGEKLIVKDLLYGLLLNSGNDAAVTLAEGVTKDEHEFVILMNEKAKKIGAEHTLFADSSGLNKKNLPFYSTSLDMAKIAYYSQTKHKELKEIYNTFIYEIPSTDTHSYKYLENQTNLLTTYPGVQGMKTGYTKDAGLCLINYADNEGKEVIVVILNSTDRRGDAILLLDYAYNKLGINIEHNLL